MKDDSFQYRRIVSEKQSFDPLWVEFYKEFAQIKGTQLTYMEFNVSIDPNPYLKNFPFPLSQIKIIPMMMTRKRKASTNGSRFRMAEALSLKKKFGIKITATFLSRDGKISLSEK